MRRLLAVCLTSLLGFPAPAAEPPILAGEAPRVRALLEQGWAAEAGQGLMRNPRLAATLYREAAALGSGEGYYRAALIHFAAGGLQPDGIAACYFAAASQMGHVEAARMLEEARLDVLRDPSDCGEAHEQDALPVRFDLDGYIAGLPQAKRGISHIIRRLAPNYSVDVRLALAVAMAESNFDAQALSPRSAMGVMQLIPATAERFGVRKPFDAEQNIRGGLAYLRWLGKYYQNDIVKVVAAYNAGERAVDSHLGIPPYAETEAYVLRVLRYYGHDAGFAGAGGRGKRGRYLPAR